MMMVDDLGGGPKKAFFDDVICEQPLIYYLYKWLIVNDNNFTFFQGLLSPIVASTDGKYFMISSFPHIIQFRYLYHTTLVPFKMIFFDLFSE